MDERISRRGPRARAGEEDQRPHGTGARPRGREVQEPLREDARRSGELTDRIGDWRSLLDIKDRLKVVENIKKITRAMQLVAAAKFKRSETRATDGATLQRGARRGAAHPRRAGRRRGRGGARIAVRARSSKKANRRSRSSSPGSSSARRARAETIGARARHLRSGVVRSVQHQAHPRGPRIRPQPPGYGRPAHPDRQKGLPLLQEPRHSRSSSARRD